MSFTQWYDSYREAKLIGDTNKMKELEKLWWL